VPYDAALGLASFDTAWARINATYYDSTFRGIDWVGLRDSLRPSVVHATHQDDVRRAIRVLFDRLGESHFMIVPSEIAQAIRGDSATPGDPGTVGLDFRVVEGRVLINSVAPGSAADRAGVRPGWTVERVGRRQVAPLLAAHHALGDPVAARRAAMQLVLRLEAAAGTYAGDSVPLLVRDAGGKRRAYTLVAAKADGQLVKYLQLPPQLFHLAHRRYADASGCVGWIHFNTWMLPVLPALERAMEAVGDCRGIVLDLRGNLGGVGGLLMGVSGFFVDSAVSLGTLTARQATLRYVVNPRHANSRGEAVHPFRGRLAILVDPLSASASELFTAGMRDIGRARVFGDTTAGEALPAAVGKLPNGDLFMHVIADFHAPQGGRIEAYGVVPDQVIPLQRGTLLRGEDAPLAAAISWAGRTPVQAAARGTTPAGTP
jgi:carboxyl-terminal processing protease